MLMKMSQIRLLKLFNLIQVLLIRWYGWKHKEGLCCLIVKHYVLSGLRSKKGKIKPSTYDKYDMILNKYLLDFFNNYHLDQLDISIIKDYFISLLDQGLSSSVVQSIKNVLKAIYITYGKSIWT